MKRSTWIILLFVLFLIGSAARAWQASAAHTARVDALAVVPTAVVVGTGNPLVDVPAVQAAVNEGGTVLLKGTFDFGSDAGNHIIVPGRAGAAQDVKGTSTVFIYQRDVTILGEVGPQGELLTTIKNGMPAFWIGWDGEISRVAPEGTPGVDYGIESFPEDAQGRVNYRDTGPEPGYEGPQTRYARGHPPVSVRVETILFDSPKRAGVTATLARDVSITGNVFTNVQFGGLIHGNGIILATRVAYAAGFVGAIHAPFIYPAITGNVVAERNVIDGVGTEIVDTHWGECFGHLALATSATVRFERDQIRNIGRQADGAGPFVVAAAGILVGDNYSTIAVVTHNRVYNSTMYGVWELSALAPSPGATIEHNTLIDCVIGIECDSMTVPRIGGLIHQNTISHDGMLGSGQSCIVLYQVDADMIRANRFEGDYSGPLVVLASSTDNTLLENRDLRPTLPPWPPTYFLDASSSGNLIRGAAGTASDLGTNNRIFLPQP